MRTIEYQDLTEHGFAPYGAFRSLIDPAGCLIGFSPIEFYRDQLPFAFAGSTQPTLSVTRVTNRPYVIDTSEFHSSSCEVQIPLDGDVLFHVGPATTDANFPASYAEVFRVPHGTAIVIRPGVWHHAPFAFGSDRVHCVVILPERTYYNDQHLVEIPAAQQLRISGPGIPSSVLS